MLQCAGCDHKWFFKKETVNKSIETFIIDGEQLKETVNNTSNKTTLLDSQIKQDFINKDIITDANTSDNNEEKEINKVSAKKPPYNRKNYNILEIIIIVQDVLSKLVN